MPRRPSVAPAALLILLAACSAPDDASSARPHELLVVRDGSGSWQDRVFTLDAPSGAVQQELPIGTPSSDWSVVYATTVNAGQTTVRAVSTADGSVLNTHRLDGAFSLPPVGPGGLPGGLSYDGRRLVLEGEPEADSSGFAVLDAASLELVAEIELPGTLTYDVQSPDGSVLFLLQYLEQDRSGRYQVRAFDIGLGRLREQVVVDKVTLQSAMEGHPVAQLLGRDGRISYTVYHNPHHGPFIHALNTTDGTAICLDLPKDGRQDHTAGRYWGLALSADGGTLLAANARLGLAAAIDTTAEKVVDTSAFGAAAATGTDIASTKQLPLPETPMLGVVTLSPDRGTLYAASPDGVAAIDAASLELRGRYLAGTTVSSVAISADGSRLYAATSGAITVVEPTSGELISELTATKQPYGIVALSPGA